MSNYTIYHNSRWGKSRATLQLLRDSNIDPNIVNYLTEPLNVQLLKSISKKLGVRPSTWIRKNENEYKINNINDSTFCYDLSYGRKLSAFNRFCLEEGASLSVNGWGMLIEQAAESFYLWRGIRPTTNGILQKLQQSS